MSERRTDILVTGGGLGGVAAAIAAARSGRTVVLTEETDWLGGQLTSQAVPPDEHPWIEQRGGTTTYRLLRRRIRDYYRRAYPLSDRAQSIDALNPGEGGVSALCHEPRVAVAAIDELLAPYRANGTLTVLTRHAPVDVRTDGDRITGVGVRDTGTGELVDIAADYVVDATELGDLLDLGGVEHVIGAESIAETGEPHALDGAADPLDQQAISWCFAIDHLPGQDHTIDKPAEYGFWRGYQAAFWPAPQLSWIQSAPRTLEPVDRPIFAGDSDQLRADDLWHYRRILARRTLAPGRLESDICLVNWPQIDYWLGPVIGVDGEDRDRHLTAARALSYCLMYWMQTEAPRPDGGTGYPGLRLRGDVTGTTDGLAMYPYIRESRRIKAEFTVLEQHVGVQARGDSAGSAIFADSVGTGSYRIDLHPSTAQRNYVDISSYPFQIPLGALIPVRVDNLLAANKNIGTTHITNGCYRLHPVEWNIGEAAGELAAACLDANVSPRAIRNTAGRLTDFQRRLESAGFDLAWPDSIRTTAR